MADSVSIKTGETLLLALILEEGVWADVTSVKCQLRKSTAEAEPPIELAVAPDAPNAKWTLSLAHTITANLEIGDYVADVRIETAEAVTYTQTIGVRVVRSVTLAAV